MASEGIFSVPLADGVSHGCLTIWDNYFEFVPEEQGDVNEPEVLGVGELEVGALYKLIVTNRQGLYRYDMEDIIARAKKTATL